MEPDNKELALNQASSGTVTVPAKSEVAEMFQGLMELARDPAVDADKMASLADLQLTMLKHKQQEEYNRDKIAALMEMPMIAKNGSIINHKTNATQSRYSKFEDIHRAVMPILRKHNLVISFNVDHNNQMVTVQPILSHTNGFVEEGGKMALPIDTTGSKNGTQGAGSAASYGKRHSMKAMLNIIEGDEDDDGTATGGYPALRSRAEEAAIAGTDAYASWFQGLNNEDRGKLMDKGDHAKMKNIAAKSD